MACDNLGTRRIVAYCFKFWGIFWIGWVMERVIDPIPLYYDNTPTVTMHSAEDITYATIGFTHAGVLKRVKKYVDNVI